MRSFVLCVNNGAKMSERCCESFVHALKAEPDEPRFRDAVRSLKIDAVSGLEKLENLASIGSALSMYFIGETYLEGHGVQQDVERGMEWLRRSADAGSIEAAYQLARTYWALDKMDKAVNGLTELSARGFLPAMYNLAQILYSDEYGLKDLNKSRKYYEMAARSGHIIAGKDLSILLIRGDFGTLHVVSGIFMWIKYFFTAIIYMTRYPESDRLRRR